MVRFTGLNGEALAFDNTKTPVSVTFYDTQSGSYKVSQPYTLLLQTMLNNHDQRPRDERKPGKFSNSLASDLVGDRKFLRAIDVKLDASGKAVFALEYERARRSGDAGVSLLNIRHVSSFTVDQTDVFRALSVSETDLSGHRDASASGSFLNGLSESVVEVFKYGAKGPKLISQSGDGRYAVLVPGATSYAVVLPNGKNSQISSQRPLRDITIAEAGTDGMVIWALSQDGHIEPSVIGADGTLNVKASNDLLVMINAENPRFVGLTTSADGTTYALDEAGHLHSYRSENGISSFRRSVDPVVVMSGPGGLNLPSGPRGFKTAKYRVGLSVNEATGQLSVVRLTGKSSAPKVLSTNIAAQLDQDLRQVTNQIVQTGANTQHILRDGALYQFGANGWAKDLSGAFGKHSGLSLTGLRADVANDAISVIAGSDTVLHKTDGGSFATYQFDVPNGHLIEAAVENGTSYGLGSDGVLYFAGARQGSFDLASQRLKSFVIDGNDTIVGVTLGGKVVRFDLASQSGAAQTPANITDETQITRAGFDTLSVTKDRQGRLVFVQADQADRTKLSYAVLTDAAAGTLVPFARAGASSKTVISLAAPGDQIVSDAQGHRYSLSGGQVFYYNHNKSEWYSSGLDGVKSLSLGADNKVYALREQSYRTSQGTRVESTIMQLNDFGQPQKSGSFELSADGLPRVVQRSVTVLGAVSNFTVKAGGGLVYADDAGALHEMVADKFLSGQSQVGAASADQPTTVDLNSLDLTAANIQNAQSAVRHNGWNWVYTADNQVYYSDASLAKGAEQWAKAPGLSGTAQIAGFALLEGEKLAIKLSDGNYQSADANGQWRNVVSPVGAAAQPGLNASETLVDLAAHDDGTLWALTSEGRLLTQTGNQGWAARDLTDLGGATLRHIQTGSDGNIVVTTATNATFAYRANTAAAGQPDNSGFTASDIVRAVPSFDQKLAELNFKRSKLSYISEVTETSSKFATAQNGRIVRRVQTQQQEFTSSENFVARQFRDIRAHLPFLRSGKASPQVTEAAQERKTAWEAIADPTAAKRQASFSAADQELLIDMAQAFKAQNLTAIGDIERAIGLLDENGAVRANWKQTAGYKGLKSAAANYVDSLGGFLRAETPAARLTRLAADPKQNAIRRVYDSRRAVFGDSDAITARLKTLLDNDAFVPIATVELLPANDLFKRLELSAGVLVNNQALMVEAGNRTQRVVDFLAGTPADRHDAVRGRLFGTIQTGLEKQRTDSKLNQLYQQNFNNLDEVQKLLSAGDQLNSSLGSANGKLYRTLQNNAPDTANIVQAYADVIKSARVGDSFTISTTRGLKSKVKAKAGINGVGTPSFVGVSASLEGNVTQGSGFKITKTATGIEITISQDTKYGLATEAALAAGVGTDPTKHSDAVKKVISAGGKLGGVFTVGYTRDETIGSNVKISIAQDDDGKINQILTSILSGEFDPYTFATSKGTFQNERTVDQKVKAALVADGNLGFSTPIGGGYNASGQRYKNGLKVELFGVSLTSNLLERKVKETASRSLGERRDKADELKTDKTSKFLASIGYTFGRGKVSTSNDLDGLVEETPGQVANGDVQGIYDSYSLSVDKANRSGTKKTDDLKKFEAAAHFDTSGELQNLTWVADLPKGFDVLDVAKRRGLGNDQTLQAALLQMGSFASTRRRTEIKAEFQTLKQRFASDTGASAALSKLEKLINFTKADDRKAFKKGLAEFNKKFGVSKMTQTLVKLSKSDSDWKTTAPALKIQYSLTAAGLAVLKQGLDAGRDVKDIIEKDLSKTGNHRISEIKDGAKTAAFNNNQGVSLPGLDLLSGAKLEYSRGGSKITFQDNKAQAIDALQGRIVAFAGKELFNVTDSDLRGQLIAERARLISDVARTFGIDPDAVTAGSDEAALINGLKTLGELPAANGASVVDRNVKSAVETIGKLRALEKTSTITSNKYTLAGEVALSANGSATGTGRAFRLLDRDVANTLLQPFKGGYEDKSKTALSVNDARAVSRRNLLNALASNQGVSPQEISDLNDRLSALIEQHYDNRKENLPFDVIGKVAARKNQDPMVDTAALYDQIYAQDRAALDAEIAGLKTSLAAQVSALFVVDVTTGKTGTAADLTSLLTSDAAKPLFALRPDFKVALEQAATKHRAAIETLVVTRNWTDGTVAAAQRGQIVSFENGVALYRDPQNPARAIRLTQGMLRKIIRAEGGHILNAMHEGFTGQIELTNTDLASEQRDLRAQLNDLTDAEATVTTTANLDNGANNVFASTSPVALLKRIQQDPGLVYRLTPAQSFVLTEFFPDASGEAADLPTLVEKAQSDGEITRFENNVRRLVSLELSNAVSDVATSPASRLRRSGEVAEGQPTIKRGSPNMFQHVPGVKASADDYRFYQTQVFREQVGDVTDTLLANAAPDAKRDPVRCGICWGLSHQFIRELRLNGSSGARRFMEWNAEISKASGSAANIKKNELVTVQHAVKALRQRYARQNAQLTVFGIAATHMSQDLVTFPGSFDIEHANDPSRVNVSSIEYLNRAHREHGLTPTLTQDNTDDPSGHMEAYGFEELMATLGRARVETYATISGPSHTMALAVEFKDDGEGGKTKKFSFFDPNYGVRYFDSIDGMSKLLKSVFSKSKRRVDGTKQDPKDPYYDVYDPAALNRGDVGTSDRRQILRPDTQSFALEVQIYKESPPTRQSQYGDVISKSKDFILQALQKDKIRLMVGQDLEGVVSSYDDNSFEMTVKNRANDRIRIRMPRVDKDGIPTSIELTLADLTELPALDSLPEKASGAAFEYLHIEDSGALYQVEQPSEYRAGFALDKDTRLELVNKRNEVLEDYAAEFIADTRNEETLTRLVRDSAEFRRTLTQHVMSSVADTLIDDDFKGLSRAAIVEAVQTLGTVYGQIRPDLTKGSLAKLRAHGVSKQELIDALPDDLADAVEFLETRHKADLAAAQARVAQGDGSKTLTFQMRDGFVMVGTGDDRRLLSTSARNALLELEDSRLGNLIRAKFTGEFKLSKPSTPLLDQVLSDTSNFTPESSVDFDAIANSSYKGTDIAQLLGSGLQVSQLSQAQIIALETVVRDPSAVDGAHHQIDAALLASAQPGSDVFNNILRNFNKSRRDAIAKATLINETIDPDSKNSGDDADSDSDSDTDEAASSKLERLARWNDVARDVSVELFRIAGQVGGAGSRPVVTAVPQAFFVGATDDGVRADGSRIRGQCDCLGLGYLHSLAKGSDGTGGRKFLEGVQLHSLTLQQAAEEQGKTSALEYKQTERFQNTIRDLGQFNAQDNSGVLTAQGQLTLKDLVSRLKTATGDVYFQVNTGNHSIAVSKQVIGRRHHYRWYDPNFGEIAISENSAALGAVKLDHMVREYLGLKSPQGVWRDTLGDFYDTARVKDDFAFDVQSFDAAKADGIEAFKDVSDQVISGGYTSELDRLAALDAQHGKVSVNGSDFTRVELYELGAVINGRYVNSDTDFAAADFAQKLRYAPEKISKFLTQRQYDARTEEVAKLVKTGLDAQSGNVASLLVNAADTDAITLQKATYAIEAVSKNASIDSATNKLSIAGGLYSDLLDVDARATAQGSGKTNRRLNKTSAAIGEISNKFGHFQTVMGLINATRRTALTDEEKREQTKVLGTTIGGFAYDQLEPVFEKGIQVLADKLDDVGTKLVSRGSVSFKAPTSKFKLAGAKLSKGLNSAAKGAGRLASRAARGLKAAGGAAVGVLGSAFDIYDAVDSFSKLKTARPEEREQLIVGGSLSVAGAAIGVGAAIGTAAAVAAGATAVASGLGIAGAAIGIFIAIGAGIYGGVKQIEALEKHIKLSGGDKAKIILLSIFGQEPPASLTNAAERASTQKAAEEALARQISKLDLHHRDDALLSGAGISTVFYSKPTFNITSAPRKNVTAWGVNRATGKVNRKGGKQYLGTDLTTSEARAEALKAQQSGRYTDIRVVNTDSGRKQFSISFQDQHTDTVRMFFDTRSKSANVREYQVDSVPGGALFNLGGGRDSVYGFTDRANRFIVFDGAYDGGSKNDLFMLDRARLNTGAVQRLRGAQGNDTAVFTNSSADKAFATNVDLNARSFKAGRYGHALTERYKLNGIENYIGSAGAQDNIVGNDQDNFLDAGGFTEETNARSEYVYGREGNDTIVLYHKTVAYGDQGNDTFRFSIKNSPFTQNEAIIHELANRGREINTVVMDMSVSAIFKVELSGNDVKLHVRDDGQNGVLTLKDIYRDAAGGGKELVPGKNFVFATKDGFVLSPSWPKTLVAGAALPAQELFIAQYVPSADQRTDEAVAVDLSVADNGSSTHVIKHADGRVIRSAQISALFRVLSGAGSLNDYVRGGRGTDLLTAGAGDDTLQGGDGADVYVVRSSYDEISSQALRTDQFTLTDLGEKTIVNSSTGVTTTDDAGKSTTSYQADIIRYGLRREDMGYRTEGQDLVIFYKPDETRAAKIRIKDFLVSEKHRHIALVDASGAVFETGVDDNGQAYLSSEGILYGEAGNDRMRAAGVTTNLFGGRGNDVLLGNSQVGQAGDNLFGGSGDDTLVGGAGDDVLIGADGSDEIRDGQGNAIIQTGNGVDRVVFDYDATGLKLIDLNNNDGHVDRISLPFDLASANIARDGNNLVVQGQAPNAVPGQLLHVVLKDYFADAKYQQVSLQSYGNIGELDSQSATQVDRSVITARELRSLANLASAYKTPLLEDEINKSTLGKGLISNTGVLHLEAGTHEFEVTHGSFVGLKIDGKALKLTPVSGRPDTFRVRYHVAQSGYRNVDLSYLQEAGESVPSLSRVTGSDPSDRQLLSSDQRNLVRNGSFEVGQMTGKVAAHHIKGLSNGVPDGWKLSYGMVDLHDTSVINDQTNAYGHSASGYGKTVLELAGSKASAIYQDLDTETGETYRISLRYRALSMLSAQDNAVEVWWDGVKVGEIAQTHTDWRDYSFEVTGRDTSRLELRAGGRNPTLGAAIDNVAVHAVIDPNLVRNGSFEVDQLTGSVTQHSINGISLGIPDGWTVGSGTPEVHDTKVFNDQSSQYGHSASGHGDKVLELAGLTNASLYQDLDTDAGKTYRISLSYRGLPAVSAAENTVEVWWGGAKVGTISQTHSDWRTYSFDVTGLDTSRLELRATGQNGTLGAAIDNVQVRRFDYPELVKNGSFEVGQLTGTAPSHHIAGLSRGVPDGWTVSFGDIEVHDTTVINNQNNPYAHTASGHGDKILELAGLTNAGIYQDLDTDAGKTYEISLSYRGLDKVSAQGNTIEVWWAGVKVGVIADTHADWRTYRFKVTGADTSRLELRASGPNGTLGAAIDNVSVKPAKPAADQYRTDRILETSQGPSVDWQGQVLFASGITSVAQAEQALSNAGPTQLETYQTAALSYGATIGSNITTYLGAETTGYSGDGTQSYQNALHQVKGQIYLKAGQHSFELEHSGLARVTIGGETVLSSDAGHQGTGSRFDFTAKRSGFYDLDLLHGAGAGSVRLHLNQVYAGHDPKGRATTVYGRNLVQNGDFEAASITQQLAQGRKAGSLSQWVLNGYNPFGQGDGVAVLDTASSGGNRFILANGTSGTPTSLSQNVTVQANRAYELSFKLDRDGSDTDHRMEVLWDGQVVKTLFNDSGATRVVTVQIPKGEAGTKALTFRMPNASHSNQVALDDITLREVRHVSPVNHSTYGPVVKQTAAGTVLQGAGVEQPVAPVAGNSKDDTPTATNTSRGSAKWRGRVVFGQQLTTLAAAEATFAKAKQSDVQTYDVNELSFFSGYEKNIGSYLSQGAANYTGDSDQALERASHHLEGQMYLAAGEHTFLVQHDDYARIKINGKDVFTVAGSVVGSGIGTGTFTFKAERAGYYSFDILHGQLRTGAQFQLQEILSGRDGTGQHHAYRPGNLVTNGSFEVGNKTFAKDTHTVKGLAFAAPEGWAYGTGANGEAHDTRVFNAQSSVYGHTNSGHGNHVLELDGHQNARIFQDLNTQGGEPYKISLLYRGLPNISADSNKVEVWWDRAKIGEIAQTHSDWRRYSFVATGSTQFNVSRLELRAAGASDKFGAAVDNVEVYQFDQGNLVKNGTFERMQSATGVPAHPLAGITYALPENWSQSFGQAEVHDTDVFNTQHSIYGHTDSGHGKRVLELDGSQNSGIYQDLNTKSGASYTLSFQYRGLNTIAAESNTVEVWWGGAKIGEIAQTHSDWKEYSFNVTGGSGGDRLEFKGAGTSDKLGAAIDNVSVVQDRYVKTLTQEEYGKEQNTGKWTGQVLLNAAASNLAEARTALAGASALQSYDVETIDFANASGGTVGSYLGDQASSYSGSANARHENAVHRITGKMVLSKGVHHFRLKHDEFAQISVNGQPIYASDTGVSGTANVTFTADEAGEYRFELLHGQQSGASALQLFKRLEGAGASGQAVELGQSDLVRNGSFELGQQSGNIPSHSIAGISRGVPDGWTVSAGDLEVHDTTVFNAQVSQYGHSASGFGDKIVELAGLSNASIYQDLDTKAGKAYRISLHYRGLPAVSAAENTVEVWWDGAKVGEIAQTHSDWRSYSFDVSGKDTSRLELRATGQNGTLGAAIDNVQVRQRFHLEPVRQGDLAPVVRDVRQEIADASSALERVQARVATAIATDDNRIARGDDNANRLISNTLLGATLQAAGGDDTLEGGFGGDTLYGDAGNDTLVGREGQDVLNGGAGVDTADYSYIQGAYDGYLKLDLSVNKAEVYQNGSFTTIKRVEDTFVGIENLVGSGNGDRLIGDGRNNVLDGGKGRDRLNGGAGADKLIGGYGHDTLDGGDGGDTLLGGDGTDRLNGGAGNDLLDGGDGNDTILDTDGNDTLNGGRGNDFIGFSLGTNIIDGGDGTDTLGLNTDIRLANALAANKEYLEVDLSRGIVGRVDQQQFDLTYLGSTLLGTRRSETGKSFDLVANARQFTAGRVTSVENVIATDNRDFITGTDGDNRIQSRGGDDFVNAGKGNDDIRDTGGNDVYVFQTGDGDDRVHDRGGYDVMFYKDAYYGTDSHYKNANVWLQRVAGTTDLRIDVRGQGHKFYSQTVQNYFGGDKVEEIVVGKTKLVGSGIDSLIQAMAGRRKHSFHSQANDGSGKSLLTRANELWITES